MNTKMQVWWIPQVPGIPFTVPVATVGEAVKVMSTLAQYDIFQFENNIKPDYSNVGGLQQWCDDVDGEGNPGWEDWYDEETGHDDPEQWLREKNIEMSAELAAIEGKTVCPECEGITWGKRIAMDPCEKCNGRGRV